MWKESIVEFQTRIALNEYAYSAITNQLSKHNQLFLHYQIVSSIKCNVCHHVGGRRHGCENALLVACEENLPPVLDWRTI